VHEAPAHEFSLDLHLCRSIGLEVEAMPESLSAASVGLTTTLSRFAAERNDDLFPRRPKEGRRPFFHFQPMPTATETIKKNSGRTKESTDGHADAAVAERIANNE
jgi:hypothetical protein